MLVLFILLHYFTLDAVVFAYTFLLLYMTMADPLGQENFGYKVNSDSLMGDNLIVLDAKDNGDRLVVLYN